MNYTINYARNLGINSQLTPDSFARPRGLGVSFQEILGAYSAFADQGERVEPYLIEKVLDRNGNLIEEHQVRKEASISPQTAYLITDLPQGVVQEGTGTKAKELGRGRPRGRRVQPTNSRMPASSVHPLGLPGVWVGYDDMRCLWARCNGRPGGLPHLGRVDEGISGR